MRETGRFYLLGLVNYHGFASQASSGAQMLVRPAAGLLHPKLKAVAGAVFSLFYRNHLGIFGEVREALRVL